MDISVNVEKKQIYTDPIKSLLIQGESQVDSIVFKLPLTYGSLALANLVYSISMTNEDSEVTITSVLTKTVRTDGVDVTWNITAGYTAVAGEFKPALACADSSGNVILKLLGDSIFVRKDPNAQGFGSIPVELYEQLLAQINYQIAHMQVIRILGTYATLSALTAAITEPSVGDMYNVGSAAPYTVYVWQGSWISLGKIEGTQGLPGAGVPTGGAIRQALTKLSAADRDTGWSSTVIQYSSMPTAAADNLGQIAQFTGATAGGFTHGHIYECVSSGGGSPTYSWSEIVLGDSTRAVIESVSQIGAIADGDGIILNDASAAVGAKTTFALWSSVKTWLASVFAPVADVPVSDASNIFACDALSLPERHFKYEIANTTAKTTTIANVPTACSIMLTIVATATAAMTWPTGTIAWQYGAPTLTSGKTYYVVLITYNGGTNWKGFWSAA